MKYLCPGYMIILDFEIFMYWMYDNSWLWNIDKMCSPSLTVNIMSADDYKLLVPDAQPHFYQIRLAWSRGQGHQEKLWTPIQYKYVILPV